MKESYIHTLFSLAILDAFKGKDIPKWISEHPALKDKSKIKKVFPSVGIKNFEEKIQIDPEISAQTIKPYAKNVIETLYKALSFILRSVNDNVRNMREKVSEPNYEELQKFTLDLGEMTRSFVHSTINDESIQIQSNGTIKIITLSPVIFVKKTIARPGESVFKVVEKIKNIFNDFAKKMNYSIPIINIDSIPEIKAFNKNNVPSSNMTIVFSSEGEGAWDLATMSMRGIKSCQSWDGDYKQCLIGSIASKYVGIIYLTSKSDYEGRGAKMVKRCIVRFGIDIKNKKPVIIMDRMYDSYDPKIAKLFLEALQKRTSVPVYNFAVGHASHFTDVENSEYRQLPKKETIQIPDENIEGIYDRDSSRGAKSYMDTEFRTKEKQLDVQPDDKLQNIFFKIKDEAKSIINSIPIFEEFKNENFNEYYNFIKYIVNFTLLEILYKIKNFKSKNKISNDSLMAKFFVKSILKINNTDVINKIKEWNSELYTPIKKDLIALSNAYINILKNISTKLVNNKEELISFMNG